MNTSDRFAFALAILCAFPSALGGLGCGAPDGSATSHGAPSEAAAVGHALPLPPAAPAQDGVSPSRLKTEGTVSGTYPGANVPFYWGGPMLTGTIDIVPIFYGTSWPTNYQSTLVSFLGSLSSKSYWSVVENYADSKGHHPGALKILPAISENDYAHGTTLGDADILSIIEEHATPTLASSSAIYLLFTDDNVGVSDWIGALCTDYLGWHQQGTISSPSSTFTGQYALVGSPAHCETAGGGAWAYSPNGFAIDEAVSAAFHEIAEATTDPDGITGYQPEIGDICAWVPGPLTTVYYSIGGPTREAKGSGVSGEISLLRHYNYDLGQGAPYTSEQNGYFGNEGTEYLVQTIWDTSQHGCAYGPVWDDLPIIQ